MTDWQDLVEPGVISQTRLPEGEYVFCDPCYAARGDIWERAITSGVKADAPCRWTDGICGVRLETENGVLAAYHTTYGDGVYYDNGGKHKFGVDSGTLGVVDLRLAIPEDEWTPFSRYFKFSGPALLQVDDFGKISIADSGGQPILEVETAEKEEILREIYKEKCEIWVARHVKEKDFREAVGKYLKQDKAPAAAKFQKWLEENGFNGEIYPSIGEMARNGELCWSDAKDRATPGWMKNLTGLNYIPDIETLFKAEMEQPRKQKPRSGRMR